MGAMEPSNNTDSHASDESLTSQPASTDSSSPKPPSLRSSAESVAPPMSSSSAPLGPINAARRPVPVPSASGLSSDYQKRIKEFVLSRGSSGQNVRPGFVNGQPRPGSQTQNTPSVGSPVAGTQSPAGALAGGISLPLGMPRPSTQNWNQSTPSAAPRLNPRASPGGFGNARKNKPMMKLSDALKPSSEDEKAQEKEKSSNPFDQFGHIVNTKNGTLTFKNKAIVDGSGIRFETGSSFSISLDEVDTISELGKGNYGTVFKVRHARPKMRLPGQGLRGNMSRHNDNSNSVVHPAGNTSGIIMAMKELRLELDDAKFSQIIMELDILHRCVSPFIIDFYGAFFQEGSVYICIEYMDGGSIDKIYGDGVPEGVLKKMTLSTVMGLKYLKDEHKIIHRDVKPTNVLVNTRGQVKICDFGVSGNLVASIARTNIGCQSYMAPERISGGGMAQAGATSGGTYSVQSDIWSLGLSIIECALGRYPYPPETYNNIFSQLSAIVDGEPPDLPTDGYSEAAHDFVRGCLNKVPGKRPTYDALIKHSWLSPLMQPPTISEDEEAEKAAEAGGDVSSSIDVTPDTADKEVANWVVNALERKRTGKMGESAKPALHTAPLDAVAATSPAADANTDAPAMAPNPGVRVESPELVNAKISSLDFASGVEQDSSS